MADRRVFAGGQGGPKKHILVQPFPLDQGELLSPPEKKQGLCFPLVCGHHVVWPLGELAVERQEQLHDVWSAGEVGHTASQTAVVSRLVLQEELHDTFSAVDAGFHQGRYQQLAEGHARGALGEQLQLPRGRLEDGHVWTGLRGNGGGGTGRGHERCGPVGGVEVTVADYLRSGRRAYTPTPPSTWSQLYQFAEWGRGGASRNVRHGGGLVRHGRPAFDEGSGRKIAFLGLHVAQQPDGAAGLSLLQDRQQPLDGLHGCFAFQVDVHVGRLHQKPHHVDPALPHGGVERGPPGVEGGSVDVEGDAALVARAGGELHHRFHNVVEPVVTRDKEGRSTERVPRIQIELVFRVAPAVVDEVSEHAQEDVHHLEVVLGARDVQGSELVIVVRQEEQPRGVIGKELSDLVVLLLRGSEQGALSSGKTAEWLPRGTF